MVKTLAWAGTLLANRGRTLIHKNVFTVQDGIDFGFLERECGWDSLPMRN